MQAQRIAEEKMLRLSVYFVHLNVVFSKCGKSSGASRGVS